MLRKLLLLCAVACAPAASAASETVTLFAGEQKLLDLPGLARVALGNPSVADVKTISAEQLLVIGVSAGETELRVWTKGGGPRSYRLVVAASTTPTEGSVQLKVGELKVLDYPGGIERVAIGNADVADVDVKEKSVLVGAVAPGMTTLMVWSPNNPKPATSLLVVTGEPPEGSAIGEPWKLSVGQTQTITGSRKVGISDWDVCHLEGSAKTGITLRGNSAGSAEVTVTLPDGKRVRHALTVTP